MVRQKFHIRVLTELTLKFFDHDQALDFFSDLSIKPCV
jgi:hypothetical protein